MLDMHADQEETFVLSRNCDFVKLSGYQKVPQENPWKMATESRGFRKYLSRSGSGDRHGHKSYAMHAH